MVSHYLLRNFFFGTGLQNANVCVVYVQVTYTCKTDRLYTNRILQSLAQNQYSPTQRRKLSENEKDQLTYNTYHVHCYTMYANCDRQTRNIDVFRFSSCQFTFHSIKIIMLQFLVDSIRNVYGFNWPGVKTMTTRTKIWPTHNSVFSLLATNIQCTVIHNKIHSFELDFRSYVSCLVDVRFHRREW